MGVKGIEELGAGPVDNMVDGGKGRLALLDDRLILYRIASPLCIAEPRHRGILTLSPGWGRYSATPEARNPTILHVPHHHHICPCIHHRTRLVDRKVCLPAICTYVYCAWLASVI